MCITWFNQLFSEEQKFVLLRMNLNAQRTSWKEIRWSVTLEKIHRKILVESIHDRSPSDTKMRRQRSMPMEKQMQPTHSPGIFALMTVSSVRLHWCQKSRCTNKCWSKMLELSASKNYENRMCYFRIDRMRFLLVLECKFRKSKNHYRIQKCQILEFSGKATWTIICYVCNRWPDKCPIVINGVPKMYCTNQVHQRS